MARKEMYTLKVDGRVIAFTSSVERSKSIFFLAMLINFSKISDLTW